ncbi:MAG: hypothetical protein ACRD8Z_06485 [Nitrososphaeraceae archaeon]
MGVLWEDISGKDYLNSALNDMNKVTLIWLPQLVNYARARFRSKILTLSEYFPKVKNEEIKEGAETIDNPYLALQ